MTKEQKPRQGGSYILNKDGSLTRTGGTEETPPAASPAPTPVDDALAEPDTSKKGK